NGAPEHAEVHGHDTALDLIRHRFGLTGTKLGCGQGVCGACAVIVDGQTLKSCLLPATSLHHRRVRTIEALAQGGSLHPVQRAFMAEDALQCGYCPPGFLLRASVFVDTWRNQHGDVAPDRDAIAAALAGHLCRCGAYEQIYAAVARACTGAFDGDGQP